MCFHTKSLQKLKTEREGYTNKCMSNTMSSFVLNIFVKRKFIENQNNNKCWLIINSIVKKWFLIENSFPGQVSLFHTMILNTSALTE